MHACRQDMMKQSIESMGALSFKKSAPFLDVLELKKVSLIVAIAKVIIVVIISGVGVTKF